MVSHVHAANIHMDRMNHAADRHMHGREVGPIGCACMHILGNMDGAAYQWSSAMAAAAAMQGEMMAIPHAKDGAHCAGKSARERGPALSKRAEQSRIRLGVGRSSGERWR